jgi:hypothetical protein
LSGRATREAGACVEWRESGEEWRAREGYERLERDRVESSDQYVKEP